MSAPARTCLVTGISELTTNLFTWPIRVYWEDTDGGGIVYYANYLKFMERARTEWLRAIGFEQGPMQQQGLIFVIVDTHVEFKRPARYGDALTVTARVREHTRATLSFTQEVFRGGTIGAEGELLVTGAIRVACFDAQSYKPKGLPKFLIDNLPT
jgi:acyl-CoA thioester hydrolase